MGTRMKGIVFFGVCVLYAVPICGDAIAIPFRDGYAKNASGKCMPLCTAGGTKINTSLGAWYPLFAEKNTSPSLFVKLGDSVCYADLVSGSDSGINVRFNDNVYHTNAFTGCPASFNLSYDCGDGAIAGAVPDTREIEWGKLFFVDANVSACYRPGYIFNGWSSGGTSYPANKYYQYSAESDTVLKPSWTAASYGIAYTCGLCDAPFITGVSNQYISATAGQSITVLNAPPSACKNVQDATFLGFKIQSADGTDTGKTVAPGETFIFDYDENLRLAARWRENPQTFTLTYSCGDDATGTPPDSRTVDYQKLFNAGPELGTCHRPGHYVSNWNIENKSIPWGGYGIYEFDSDETIVPEWTAMTYGIPYTCGRTCEMPFAQGSTNKYLSGKYGDTITVLSELPSGCVNYAGGSLQGYKIYDSMGVDTGDTVPLGGTFTFVYDDNIRLVPYFSGVDTRPRYTLSYSCGDDATGTPPDSRLVKYKGLIMLGADVGTCNRPGYYLSWNIGDKSFANISGYTEYTYTDDETMVPEWTAMTYGAAYVCNNGKTTTSYLSVQSGVEYTPSTTVCTAPTDKTFAGYAVQSADGTDTGDRIGVGESFIFNYDENIRLSAMWE